jgi:hypothetical protein
MKKLTTLTLIGAASALALSATAASAQPYGERDGYRGESHRNDGYRSDYRGDRNGWISINERQAQLDRRIEQGLRNGSLTRQEAWRLRAEFRDIARLEARYRMDGLSGRERADLDRRFDRLAAQIRYERRDNQYGYGYGHDNRR